MYVLAVLVPDGAGTFVRNAKNSNCWALGRINAADLKTWLDENAGTFFSREQLMEAYSKAVSKKYGFLFYRPKSGDPENMLYSSFTERLVPT